MPSPALLRRQSPPSLVLKPPSHTRWQKQPCTRDDKNGSRSSSQRLVCLKQDGARLSRVSSKGRGNWKQWLGRARREWKGYERRKKVSDVFYVGPVCTPKSTWSVASIPYPELLAYAQSLSAFTSAPPNMPDPNAPLNAMHGAPVPLFFPPFPNEEKMRRGRLNVEKPLGGLGESHSVKREYPYDGLVGLSHIFSQRGHRRQSPRRRRGTALVSTRTDTKYARRRRRSLTWTWISTRTCDYITVAYCCTCLQ